MPSTSTTISGPSAGTAHVTRVRNTCRPKAQYRGESDTCSSTGLFAMKFLRTLAATTASRIRRATSRMTLRGLDFE